MQVTINSLWVNRSFGKDRERTQKVNPCIEVLQTGVCFINDDGQGEDDSIDFLGFGRIFYSLSIVEQPFSLPELFASDESDYVDVVEEVSDLQEYKGKAPMFSASHVIREQGSSIREKTPNILRSLLPLTVNDNQDPVPEGNQTMKILIGVEEVDVRNPHDWPNVSIKPKPIKPPDECIEKKMIYMPPPLEGLPLGDYVEIWMDECKYNNRETPSV